MAAHNFETRIQSLESWRTAETAVRRMLEDAVSRHELLFLNIQREVQKAAKEAESRDIEILTMLREMKLELEHQHDRVSAPSNLATRADNLPWETGVPGGSPKTG